jgi:hypothetical protein
MDNMMDDGQWTRDPTDPTDPSDLLDPSDPTDPSETTTDRLHIRMQSHPSKQQP